MDFENKYSNSSFKIAPRNFSLGCDMNSQTTMSNSSQDSSDSQGDSRLTVADILSSMANGEVITSLQYTAVEGFSTGIPTRTTPTLTPTTLRNIEQTFIELQSVPPPVNHNHQAGFVPPVISTNATTPTSQSANFPVTVPIKEETPWYQCSLSASSRMSSKSGVSPQSRLVTSTSSGNVITSTKGSGRHMGGRRPRDDKLSPEEEERRRVRRERNKLAAARCRKRRLDHTNSLLSETEGLEEKRQELQKEIHELQSQKDHLEFILEAHRCMCKNNGKIGSNGVSVVRSRDLKETSSPSTITATVPTSYASTSSSELAHHKPLARPTSLQINSSFSAPTSTCMKLTSAISTASEIVGIPISTPSTGIFNFDSLLDGSTGLTPVSTGLTPVIPTCSSQQRCSNTDLSSPDNMNPPKLVSL